MERRNHCLDGECFEIGLVDKDGEADIVVVEEVVQGLEASISFVEGGDGRKGSILRWRRKRNVIAGRELE